MNEKALFYFQKGMQELQKDNSKALECFKLALEFDESAVIYFYIALTYCQMNKINEAIEYLTKTIERNPKFVDAYRLRSCLYIDLKQYDKAAEDAEMAMKLKPNLDTYLECAMAFHKKEDYEKELKILNETVKKFPSADSYYSRAIFHLWIKKDIDKAFKDIKKALEYNSNDPQILAIAGRIFQLKGIKELAREFLEKAYSLGAEKLRKDQLEDIQFWLKELNNNKKEEIC